MDERMRVILLWITSSGRRRGDQTALDIDGSRDHCRSKRDAGCGS
jgi:hypothetical protein